jgi:hypothetical protein
MADPMGTRSVALVLVLSAGSCASAPTPLSQNNRSEVVLAPGGVHRIAGTDLTLVLEAVAQDSRCPKGVNCVWAGDAAVRIRLEPPPTAYTLHTNDGFEREIAHGNVRVRLVSLTPEPTADGPPRPDTYRATLSIERK